MFRFHIKPIPKEQASPHIAAAYTEIQQILHIEAVPLVFQYIANYELYFFYIWDRMKANLLSSSFDESCEEIRKFSEQAVIYFETPTLNIKNFVHAIHPEEVAYITKIVNKLDSTNYKMMLLLIGVRESIKGIYQARDTLPVYDEDASSQSADEIFQVTTTHSDSESAELSKATKMLAPLFGNNALMISHYPDFFAHIASEMETLSDTEGYLLTRVGLEHLSFAYIEQFVQPLECSYAEFMRLTEGTGYVDEILYMLKDTFPSRFPHLVLTTAVMKKALQKDTTSLVRVPEQV